MSNALHTSPPQSGSAGLMAAAGSAGATRSGGRHAWFWEALDLYLAKRQLKQTRQRRLIVDCFLRIDSHPDAEELHRKINKEGHKIGLATVYRTLNLLTEAGLVEQKSFQDGRSVYEVQEPDTHHDHLICGDCGKVVEFENAEIEALQEKIAADFGFRLKSHRLDLVGQCIKPNCPEQRKHPKSKA